jgi:Na+-driven multidrug efflux pump
MIRRFPELRMTRGEFRADFKVMRYLLSMGLPMALQFSITAVGGIILQSTVNPYGSAIVATVTAAQKVQMVLNQPMEAMGATMATYASQNLGAGEIGRIRTGVRKALLLVAGFSVLGLVGGMGLGPKLSLLFVEPGQTEILAGIQRYLWVVGLFFFALGTLLVLRNVIQGVGHAVPAMAAGLFELFARAMVGILFVRPFGFDAICFANPAAWIAANLLLIPVYFFVMRQVTMRVQQGR